MNKSIKAEIAFGAGLDRDNNPIDCTDKWATTAQENIQRLACELFGGFTWYNTVGGWAVSDELILEEGRNIVIVTTENKRHEITRFAGYVRDQLLQKCVALTVTPVEFTII